MDVECPFMAENKLMGALSGSAFLALVAMMDRLGPIISCVPVCAGDMELGLELGIGVFKLAVTTSKLTSRGIEPSLPVSLTFLGVRKYAHHCATRL